MAYTVHKVHRVEGRTDTVPGSFDAAWLDRHATDTNVAVTHLEDWFAEHPYPDDELRETMVQILVDLRQRSETLAFAGRQWNGGKVDTGSFTVVGDATSDQVAEAVNNIRSALQQIQWVGNDWNAGVRAAVETKLGNALKALGAKP